MKKLICIVSLLAFTGCLVLFGFPAEENAMAVVRSGDVFKVIYENKAPVSVKVIIFDKESNEIFSEKINSSHGFTRPYNFSQLPEGDYVICVKAGPNIKSEKICFHDEEFAMHKNESNANQKDGETWFARAAKLNGAEEKVLVCVPCQKPTDFSVRIYDFSEKLIYDERHSATQDFAKVYRLKNFEEGAVVELINYSTGQKRTFPITGDH